MIQILFIIEKIIENLKNNQHFRNLIKNTQM